jgi:hypothetical protein
MARPMGLGNAAAARNEGRARQPRPQTTPISALLLAHDSDMDAARQLAGLLAGAGVSTLEASASAAGADAVVVFLSASGLASPDWKARVTEVTQAATRLIPVRVGQIDDRQVPARLATLNWIDWQPGNVQATFGYVVAGLFSNPGRRHLSRQLSHEAEAWLRSGRRDALLIADYQRARRMSALLRDLEADQLAAPTAVMQQFVQRSVQIARPKHRRRRTWRIVGAVGAVVALLVAAAAIPAIKLASFNNQESVVTTGDPAMLQDLPEWSAANAAALLVDGTPAEQALARVTLLRALDQPWELDALQWSIAPNSSVPFDRGRLAVISVRVGLAIINVGTQRALWTTVEPGGPYYLAVDPAGRTALGLALSGKGAIVINLVRHTVRRIAIDTEFSNGSQVSYGVLGSDGIAVVRLPGQRLEELNTITGAVSNLGAYPPIIALAGQTAKGTPTVLIRSSSGRMDLIEIPSRRVLASLSGTPSAGAGAISPDGRQAVVEGSDGQFWEIGAGHSARPTGIPVPRILSGVTWATGDRIVVASQDQRGQVYYLPRAEPLGTICTQNEGLDAVIPDSSSAVVACESPGITTFWRLPPGPLAHREPGESTASSWTSGPVTVTRSGASIDIRGPGVDSGMFEPLGGFISVIDVADNGQRVVVGDVLGEVAVIDVQPGYFAEVVAWTDPDNSPIAAVGWDNGPVATTESGQTWRIADCAGCTTIGGLLRAFRDRVTGCFTVRQLQFMAARTWQALGLRECTPQPGLPAPVTPRVLAGS